MAGKFPFCRTGQSGKIQRRSCAVVLRERRAPHRPPAQGGDFSKLAGRHAVAPPLRPRRSGPCQGRAHVLLAPRPARLVAVFCASRGPARPGTIDSARTGLAAQGALPCSFATGRLASGGRRAAGKQRLSAVLFRSRLAHLACSLQACQASAPATFRPPNSSKRRGWWRPAPMLRRCGLLESTTATLALCAVTDRAALGVAPIKSVGMPGTFDGFHIYGRPMVACLGRAGSDPNELGGLLDAPYSPSSTARRTTSGPARGRPRGADRGR